MSDSSSSSSDSSSSNSSQSSSSLSSSSSSSASSNSSSSQSSVSDSSSSYLIPDLPSDGDIIRAIANRFDQDDIGLYLKNERPDDTTNGNDFPPIQKTMALKGTPYPYVVISTGTGNPIGGSSNRTVGGKIFRYQMFDTPVQIITFHRVDDDAERIGKIVGRSIERANLEICGSQKFVTLFRTAMPIVTKENEELYSFTLAYTVRTDVETAI